MRAFTILTILASLIGHTSAFAPLSTTPHTTPQTSTTHRLLTTQSPLLPPSLTNQRKSTPTGQIQTMGLFGLGGPEIAIILVAAAFVLGPQKLAELGKDAGKIAGELKEVPKEFAKGLEEGEAEALVTKRKILNEDVEVDATTTTKE
mmetsp:Transcript_12669/g.14866  ORF Transcript_12669/g.14866 Transcript_12669/m.14866 type:complete len:147 (+) Transcript_12669:94-534(+)